MDGICKKCATDLKDLKTDDYIQHIIACSLNVCEICDKSFTTQFESLKHHFENHGGLGEFTILGFNFHVKSK